MQGSNREAGSGFEAEHSPEEALAELKRIFRAARTAKRLTMAGLETKAGRSHTTVSQALSGPTVPSEATVDALSVALGLDPDAMVKLRNRAAGKGADTEPSPETAERSPVQNFVGLRVRAEMTFHALSEKEVDTALGTPVMVAKAGGRDIVPEEALIHVTVVNETDQTFQVTGLLVEAWEKGPFGASF